MTNKRLVYSQSYSIKMVSEESKSYCEYFALFDVVYLDFGI